MIKINTSSQGVKATLSGFNTKDISDKIQACQEGACECACDPEIMSKIKDIKITGEGDVTTIEVIGDVDAKVIAPMMQECLLEKVQ